MKLFAFYDVKSSEYLCPFEASNETNAIRAAVSLLRKNPNENRYVIHRSDFVLVQVGDFDITTGVFEQVAPRPITTLSALYDSMPRPEVDHVS